jgi:sulfur-carrier protein
MVVSVVCFGAMRSYLPEMSFGNRADVELPDGSSVADLIDAMGAPRELVFSVLVDGTQAPHDHTLGDRAEVTLMPPFAGGAQARLGRQLDLARLSAGQCLFDDLVEVEIRLGGLRLLDRRACDGGARLK